MEVASIATLWAASSSPASLLPPPETVKWLTDRFVHILRFFSFFPSTPSSVVARELEAAFFLCVSKAKGIPFLTELGVKEASVVRMPQPAVESFVKQVRCDAFRSPILISLLTRRHASRSPSFRRPSSLPRRSSSTS